MLCASTKKVENAACRVRQQKAEHVARWAHQHLSFVNIHQFLCTAVPLDLLHSKLQCVLSTGALRCRKHMALTWSWRALTWSWRATMLSLSCIEVQEAHGSHLVMKGDHAIALRQVVLQVATRLPCDDIRGTQRAALRPNRCWAWAQTRCVCAWKALSGARACAVRVLAALCTWDRECLRGVVNLPRVWQSFDAEQHSNIGMHSVHRYSHPQTLSQAAARTHAGCYTGKHVHGHIAGEEVL